MTMFNLKHKGYGLLLPTVACAALIGGVGLGVTKMSNVSVGAILSTKTKYIGQQYALNTADKYCRLHNYASLAGINKRKIDGSDDYYEEVVVTDSTVPIVNGSTEMSSVASKDIIVNVYHKEADRMPLVSSIKLYRTDPATFEPGFNMVANDATSMNEYQAMSANAFRELLKSKISDDITADTGDVAMSANASKLYINSVLKNYALADDTVSVENDAGVGSPFRGVYINQDGVAKPIDVIVRGNKSTDADPLVLVPEKKGSTWQFNTIRKSQLKGSEKTTFTVTIKQTPNQTITVTTGDGVKHTESFDAKKGTTWTATVNGATGYNPGKLISTSGTITGATTVSATEATIKQFDFNITQSEGQTITVTTGDGIKHTESFKAKYGTTWSATVTADEGSKTQIGKQLDSGTFNFNKNITVPSDVTQLKIVAGYGGYGGPNGGYGNNLFIMDIDGKEVHSLASGGDNSLAEIYHNVTPSSTITIKGIHDDMYEIEAGLRPTVNQWAVYVNNVVSGSDGIAGNLIVNGTDTGSTSGSGTVMGTVSVSAKEKITLPDEEKKLFIKPDTGEYDVYTDIIPDGVNVIRVEVYANGGDWYPASCKVINQANQKSWGEAWGYGAESPGLPSSESEINYVGVTPGAKYRICKALQTDGDMPGDGWASVYYSKEINTYTPNIFDYKE